MNDTQMAYSYVNFSTQQALHLLYSQAGNDICLTFVFWTYRFTFILHPAQLQFMMGKVWCLFIKFHNLWFETQSTEKWLTVQEYSDILLRADYRNLKKATRTMACKRILLLMILFI